jgi:RNA polymerase sigma-70 factor (ECF subfamily)
MYKHLLHVIKSKAVSRISQLKLIRQAQKGDTDALETIINHYYDNIFSYLYRNTGDKAIAEDLTQDVFLKLVNALAGYRPVGKFSNFVFTIAVNVRNDYYRKNKLSIQEYDLLNVDAGVDIEKILIRKDQSSRLKEAIQKLPDAQKDTILLRFFHDMKIKDIAKITSTNPSTVKSRVSNGLKKLKSLLSEVDTH